MKKIEKLTMGNLSKGLIARKTNELIDALNELQGEEKPEEFTLEELEEMEYNNDESINDYIEAGVVVDSRNVSIRKKLSKMIQEYE